MSDSSHPAEDDFAVRVQDVSKVYGLWSSPNARLQHVLLEGAKGLLPSHSRAAGRINRKIASIYREFRALESVSLDIRKGESWGFIGVNGSGKSTLLKMISGNLRPSAGRIEVDGRVAILDYSSGLHGDFTGRENIFLKASIMGMGRRETEAKLQSIIDFADIGAFIDQPVKTYSSGMQARLGFAIVAHVDADIIITDEALAVGDAFFVQKCMDYIRGFLKRGTFLFVSHSTNDVVSLCQKAVWLEHGRVKQIGSAKEVAEAYLTGQSLDRSRKVAQARLSEVVDQEEDGELVKEGVPGRHVVASVGNGKLAELMDFRPIQEVRDDRLRYLNHSKWRNDIEIPTIEMAGVYGIGGAKIEKVAIESEDGAAYSWIVGGEAVTLRVRAVAERHIHEPIIGFAVLDRLGQVLFADNTYLATLGISAAVSAGEVVEAEFRFQMPLLPVGEYAVRAAIVDGTDANGAVMHSIQSALVFRSVTSGTRHGLVGIPMLSVTMSRERMRVVG